MKILISKKTGIKYYYNEDKDFHCKEGFILEKHLKSGDKVVKTNTMREFLVFNASDYDYTQKIKRGPQLITNKDLGYILSRTRINKNAFIVEAGSGSGAATIFFANLCKKVHSYDIVKDHLNITEKNLKSMNIDNVELFEGDLAEYIENEKDMDLLFLDMPDPTPILEKNLNGVKEGQYIVCYVPSITQVQAIVEIVKQKDNLYFDEISEVILRHWRVTDRIARPEHRKEIDHTAFLVFIRRI